MYCLRFFTLPRFCPSSVLAVLVFFLGLLRSRFSAFQFLLIFFLISVNNGNAVVSHSFCCLLFFPRTVWHVTFQVSLRPFHCFSTVSSDSSETTLKCSSVQA
jgi:hypothetical protein